LKDRSFNEAQGEPPVSRRRQERERGEPMGSSPRKKSGNFRRETKEEGNREWREREIFQGGNGEGRKKKVGAVRAKTLLHYPDLMFGGGGGWGFAGECCGVHRI